MMQALRTKSATGVIIIMQIGDDDDDVANICFCVEEEEASAWEVEGGCTFYTWLD